MALQGCLKKTKEKSSSPTCEVVGCCQVMSKIHCHVTGFMFNWWDPEDMARQPAVICQSEVPATSRACPTPLCSRVTACPGEGTAHLMCLYHQTQGVCYK